jgi:hypothetical protein
VDLSPAALTDIARMLEGFVERNRWSENAGTRLNLVVEEAVLTLLEQGGENGGAGGRRLVASIHPDGDAAEVELVVYSQDQVEGNIEDQLAFIGEPTAPEDAQQLSTRLLKHYASSVHHRKYHGIDVITCRIDR